MSELENSRAKPAMADLIVSTSPADLTVFRLASIAAFTFKSAVIADYMRETGAPFFSPSVRRNFASRLVIPSSIWMWLATLRDTEGHSGIFKTSYGIGTGRLFPGIELYVFTYAAGHLVVQMVGGRWKNKSLRRRRRFPPVVQNVERFAGMAIPFWPGDGKPVAWPPTEHLNGESLEKFCDRWSDVTIEKIGQ